MLPLLKRFLLIVLVWRGLGRRERCLRLSLRSWHEVFSLLKIVIQLFLCELLLCLVRGYTLTKILFLISNSIGTKVRKLRVVFIVISFEVKIMLVLMLMHSLDFAWIHSAIFISLRLIVLGFGRRSCSNLGLYLPIFLFVVILSWVKVKSFLLFTVSGYSAGKSAFTRDCCFGSHQPRNWWFGLGC